MGGTVTYTLRVANPTPKAITYRIDFSTNWEPNTDGEFEVVNDPTGLGYPRTFTALASSDTKTLPPGKSFTDTVRLSPSQGVFQSRGRTPRPCTTA